MKILTALAAGALVLAAPSVALAQDAPTAQMSDLQLARDIVDQGYPAETRMAMFTGFVDQLIGQMIGSNPSIAQDPELNAAVDSYVDRVVGVTQEVLARHMDSLMGSLVTAYAEQFTREELEGLHAFITSPAGQGFLAKSTLIMANPAFAEANQRYMADYMTQVPQLQAEFQADLARIRQNRQK